MVVPKPKVTQETMGSLSCEEQKRAYQESVRCFDRYRKPDGSLVPNAFRNCQELKQPRC